ncbi:MAG: WYL domain-containing protein [Bacillota bacterium]
MIRQLERYRRRGNRVVMIYVDRLGRFSQREVVILSVGPQRITAYCCTKKGIRKFATENILAVLPAKGRVS